MHDVNAAYIYLNIIKTNEKTLQNVYQTLDSINEVISDQYISTKVENEMLDQTNSYAKITSNEQTKNSESFIRLCTEKFIEDEKENDFDTYTKNLTQNQHQGILRNINEQTFSNLNNIQNKQTKSNKSINRFENIKTYSDENVRLQTESTVCNKTPEEKIKTQIAQLFAREIDFNKEVENRRLALFGSNKLSPHFYFKLIDVNECGFVDYSLMSLFMMKQKLNFTVEDWNLLLFRIKKLCPSNTIEEEIKYIEFHDLIYPLTYFHSHSVKEYIKWKIYLTEKLASNPNFGMIDPKALELYLDSEFKDYKIKTISDTKFGQNELKSNEYRFQQKNFNISDFKLKQGTLKN